MYCTSRLADQFTVGKDEKEREISQPNTNVTRDPKRDDETRNEEEDLHFL